MTSDRPDPSRPEDPDRGLDIDATFAEIVAHWEPPPADDADPDADDRSGADDRAESRRTDPAPGEADSLRDLFRPAWDAPEPEEAKETEEHFVPPPPPPLPAVEPRRRLAWVALLGTPLAGLVLVLLGMSISDQVAFLLVATFVGGFTYLVATMGSSPRDGDWPGGDGAVL